jgi:cytochrome c-type biogenesis protein CcmH/NrfG
MGRLHLATKMPFTAVRDLEAAVRLDPGDVHALCDLGQAYQQTLNFKSALAVYERVLRRDPRNLAARIGRGKTWFGLTDYDRARRELQAALAVAPVDAAALGTLGRLELQRATAPADLVTAKQLLERATRADPGDPEPWYDLGRVNERLGQPAAAIVALDRALRLSPQHPGAFFEMGHALRAAGRTREADRVDAAFRQLSLESREESRLEEQVHQSPHDWNAQARLAELYLGTGKPGMAALLCKQIAEGDPRNPRLDALLAELKRRRTGSVAAAPMNR